MQYPRYMWLCFLLLAACARTSSPTGGEVDVEPPIPVSISPPLFTLFFSEMGFMMEFDEYIKADDLGSQLIVSPPLAKRPTYKVRGRKLYVQWEDELQPDATYQFNFGKGVADVNEGNANTDLRYVFSTGSYIDSMQVHGIAIKAATNEPMAKASVMLYRNLHDTVAGKSLPDYFTLTRDDGTFSIGYLPPDTFQLLVVDDRNNNYLYDGSSEQVGFIASHVLSSFGDSLIKWVVPVFQEQDTLQFLAEVSGKDFGYYQVVFNRPARLPQVYFRAGDSGDTLWAFTLLCPTADTLRAWVPLPRADLDQVSVAISDGAAFADTIQWYIETDVKYREKGKLVSSANVTGGKLDLGAKPTFRFNHPIAAIDTSLITLYRDSIPVALNGFELHADLRRLELNYPLSRTEKYLLVARKGAFTDVFGYTNDSLAHPFAFREPEYYGLLRVKINLTKPPESGQVLVWLTDQKGNPLLKRTIAESTAIDFGRLHPGKYGLRVIWDENGNHKWDTGRWHTRTFPERLSIYQEPIDLRSNWELDLEFTPASPFD